MYKADREEFNSFLVNFQVAYCASLLQLVKKMSNEESFKKAQELMFGALEDSLIEINFEDDDYFDQTIYQNLYEFYLRRFSEKQYLEIGQFEEEYDNDLD